LEALTGALAASNAAAGVAEKAAPAPTPSSEPRPRPKPRATIELIWFEPSLGAQLSKSPAFAALIRPPASPDPGAAEEAARAQVYDVLSKGTPWNGRDLDAAIDTAEEDVGPTPLLALVRGDIEFPFDEIEVLKALVAAASSLAGSDKKLKETLDLAAETLKNPLQGMPEIAAGLSASIREAWSKANRALPASYLDTCTERALLEQRRYQKRELLDDTWIRALLASDAFDAPVPTYLPSTIARRIPLFKRFSARLLVEVLPQQDQYEVHPIALRAAALARAAAAPRPRSSRDHR